MQNVKLVIRAAVEGILDEVVLKAILHTIGMEAYPVFGKNGKHDLRRKIENYNRAAQMGIWIILVDLDDDFECAPLLFKSWLKDPAPKLSFRVAVRAVESWLMADSEALSDHLGIPHAIIPGNPDLLEDPKRTMVNLARKSRRRKIKLDMVPAQRGGRKIGPAYTSCLIEFVTKPQKGWNPLVAVNRSESLKRFLNAMRTLISPPIQKKG